MDLAAQVHYCFLLEDYEDDRISIAVSLRPLFPIGGDYCSVLVLDDQRLLVCMCDAVGHGTAAALFASRINTYVLVLDGRDAGVFWAVRKSDKPSEIAPHPTKILSKFFTFNSPLKGHQ